MNKPISAADFVAPKVTTGGLAGSRKVYATPESAPDLRVPIREILLTPESGEPPLPVLLAYAKLAGVSTDVLIDDELDLPAKLPAKPKHAR